MPAKLKSLDSHFVQVDIEFAKEHSLNEAVLAGKMLRLEEKLTGLIDDNGIKWVRLTLDEWCKELPFMKEMTIRRTIELLESKGIFLSTTFSGRSKWYRMNPYFVEDKHNVCVQNEQIHYDNCSFCTDTSVQNEQLPIIHSYNPSLSLTTAKTGKDAESILKHHRDLAIKLISVCGYASPEFVVNGKKIECANTILQLVAWSVTPSLLEKFSKYWWGASPPTFRQIESEWGKFINYLNHPEKFSKVNGASNGKSQNHFRQNESAQPTGEELANQRSVDIYTNEWVYPDGHREPVS